MYEYTGVIHCHSDYSDGRASYDEIIQSARRAGLDYLIMTDHDTLKPLWEGQEGWYGETFLLIGTEVSPPVNHYLSLGTSQVPERAWPPQMYIDYTNQAGGIGFIAHPFDTDNPLLGIPSYDWVDWAVTGYTGLEIWNFMTSWSGLCRDIPSAARALLRMWQLLPAPFPQALAKWDELTLSRPVVGIGSVDAHSLRVQFGRFALTALTHYQMFCTIRTNLYLTEALAAERGQARRQILAALRRGHCCIIDAGHGFAGGFSFRGEVGGRVWQMGDEVTYCGPAYLTAELPDAAKIVLYRNGQAIQSGYGKSLVFTARERGVYRVEAYRAANTVPRPWFISNPIYLR